MSYCEDFPACGHESGCCPDFDPDTGKQLNMRCTCGAIVSIDSRFSICDGCLKRGSREDGDREEDGPEREPVECSNPDAIDDHDLGSEPSECSRCEEYLDDMNGVYDSYDVADHDGDW